MRAAEAHGIRHIPYKFMPTVSKCHNSNRHYISRWMFNSTRPLARESISYENKTSYLKKVTTQKQIEMDNMEKNSRIIKPVELIP